MNNNKPIIPCMSMDFDPNYTLTYYPVIELSSLRAIHSNQPNMK